MDKTMDKNFLEYLKNEVEDTSLDEQGGHLTIYHNNLELDYIVDHLVYLYKELYNYNLPNLFEELEYDEDFFSVFIGMELFPINGTNTLLSQVACTISDDTFSSLIECEMVDELYDYIANNPMAQNSQQLVNDWLSSNLNQNNLTKEEN